MKNLCRHLRFTVLFALLLAAFFLPAATGMAAGQSITTLFASNNLAAGNMFNVTVLASVDIRIDSFDINLHEAAEASLVSAYYRPGGYEGYESDANAWTFAGSADVISQGQDNPTPLPVGNIRLTAGKHTASILQSATIPLKAHICGILTTTVRTRIPTCRSPAA